MVCDLEYIFKEYLLHLDLTSLKPLIWKEINGMFWSTKSIDDDIDEYRYAIKN